MDAINAARAAGWVYCYFDRWMSTDLQALADMIHPWPFWTGTAGDLCLAHGIGFTETHTG